MKIPCPHCNGIGHVFSYRRIAMYGDSLERFYIGPCRYCATSGFIALPSDGKQLAANDHSLTT
jgi:hypothetical protein